MPKGILLAAVLGLLCVSAAKKPAPVSMQIFHEASAIDGKFAKPVTLLNPPKETNIAIMPLLTERDITAFYPFDAPDGTSGAYFRLGPHGTSIFEQYTMGSRGSYLVAVVNGRHVVDLLVTGGVSDGILVIPHGLRPSDIMAFGAAYDVIGQPANEARRRTKNLKRALAGDFDRDDDAPVPAKKTKAKPTPKPVPTPKPQKPAA